MTGGLGEHGARSWLTSALARRLRVRPDEIAPDEPLVLHGLDSFRALELAAEIYARFEVEVPPETLHAATIAQLAKQLGSPGERRASAPPERGGALSLSQEQIWSLDQRGDRVPNLRAAIRWKGRLDTRALESTLGELLVRHSSLRARCTIVDGKVHQVIAPPLVPALPVVFIEGLSNAEFEAEVVRRAAEEAHRPFDLTQGPLLRAQLFKFREHEHVLLLTTHRIASDSFSLDLLLRDTIALYQALSRGERSATSADAVSAWSSRRLEGEALDTQLAYWEKRLSGMSLGNESGEERGRTGPRRRALESKLPLPTDRLPRVPQPFQGARHSFELPQALSLDVKALSHREKVSPFVFLLATFKALLHRYSRQERILVGCRVNNRTRAERGMVGCFSNTLPLVTDLSGDPPFRELLRRVQETVSGAYAHKDVPIELVVDKLTSGEADVPAFQVIFAQRNGSDHAFESSDLTATRVNLGPESPGVELSLAVELEGDRIVGSVDYNSELFELATIARLVGHLATMLRGIVASLDERISLLPILSDPERRQVLVEWNDTRREHAMDRCVHELFEDQAARTPDAVAVVFEDRQLTYRELNRRANQLAYRLRELEVGPDVLVGMCVERSLEMIVGLLGILKAGGAYLALDLTYPKDRLQGMLQDAKVSVLLTQERLLSSLPEREGQTLLLDSEWDQIARSPSENHRSGVTVENLIYVIFTSGSTGRPKGVGLEHRQLLNYLGGIIERLNLPPGTSYATVSTIAADLGNTVIFPALVTGGCLHVVSEARISDPVAFAEYFRRHSIECLKIVPTHLAALLAAGADVLPRRRLVLGGEASHWESIEKIRALAPQCAILNHYGPTETTVGICTYPIGEIKAQCSRTVPIGRPLHNTQIYIADAHLNPVPVGVPGEVYVGGACLARGYLDRPEDTAKKFIPDSFTLKPGARLYKTGDLARYLSDGNIEFLGRIDNQVKIRGYRIELGEIEAALCQSPAVREAVVLARDGASAGEKLLVAYVVPKRQPPPSANELRRFLKERLPGFMIPASFVIMDALPLTPNGKVDRRMLPMPAIAQPQRALPMPPEENHSAGSTYFEEEP